MGAGVFVSPLVRAEVAPLREALAARVAGEGLLPGVNPLVDLQVAHAVEALAAKRADEPLLLAGPVGHGSVQLGVAGVEESAVCGEGGRVFSRGRFQPDQHAPVRVVDHFYGLTGLHRVERRRFPRLARRALSVLPGQLVRVRRHGGAVEDVQGVLEEHELRVQVSQQLLRFAEAVRVLVGVAVSH